MDLQKLRVQLIKHEGLRLKPYVDTVGKITIGIGHNLTDNGLTHRQVMDILLSDMLDTVNLLNVHLPWWITLDEIRQTVLANMTFNLATKILDFRDMLRAMQDGNWDLAADELLSSKFATQVGRRATELATMLRTGIDV